MIPSPAALGCAALVAASVRWNWWRLPARGLAVLMYHKVGTPPPGSRLESLWVGAEEFRWQMEYLLRRGRKPLLFSELAQALERDLPLPEQAVLVTFDDGYANNYELAFPILRELGVKANVFLVHDSIGGHNAWHDPGVEPWLRMLTWEAVLEMQASGLVEFGSHTMSHPRLLSLPVSEARWEILESKRRLEERLGRRVTAFAYPYGAGAYVPELRRISLEGYPLDFGIKQGFSPWPWRREEAPLRRLFIRGDDTRFDFHLQLTRGKSRF